jgi:hypothetical protein
MLQVFVTLLVCRACGKLLSYLKQPPVMGEIIGGILLGPSVLGQSQAWMDYMWPQTDHLRSQDTFGVVANVGLIFFMWIMGMELDPKLLKKQWKSSVPIATTAIMSDQTMKLQPGTEPRPLCFQLLMPLDMLCVLFFPSCLSPKASPSRLEL